MFRLVVFFGGGTFLPFRFHGSGENAGVKRSGRGSGPIGLIDGATASEQSLVGANVTTGLSG